MKALAETKILDLSDERGIYGVKLLADHGANTVRPELSSGDPLRKRGPFTETSRESLWYMYYASSRKHINIDINDSQSINSLQTLAAHADICVLGIENELHSHLDLEQASAANPALVVVECSPFGSDGPMAHYKAPEIVAAALGGSAAVTGDVDTPPLKLFGELNFTLSGTYTAIAAMAALRHAKQTGTGQRVEVPAHECIASSLEHVFMWYFYQQFSPNATAAALERRGSLHWTNLYEVMETKDGAMMVTPTPNLDAQLAWLIEEDAFQDLLEPKYEETENRREFYNRFMQVIRDWVKQQETEDLFFKAQDRHSPYGWVQNIEQVVNNPQLAARNWFQPVAYSGKEAVAPGPAYRLSNTPGSIEGSEWVDVDESNISQTLGWE